MSGANPPGAAALPRPRARWLLWGCLAAGIAVITVVVPPLVAGRDDKPARDTLAGAAPTGSATPSASAGASATASAPAASTSPRATAGPTRGGGVAASPTPAPNQAGTLSTGTTTTTTVTPISITTTAGFIGDGQSVTSLRVKDLSGNTDNWDRYVEFSSGYAGYLTFSVPTTVVPATVTRVVVRVAYRGPATSTQTWTFRLRAQASGAWTTVGNNELAPNWGAWTTLSFTAGGTGSGYISGQRTMQLQITGSSARDTADIDYVALVLTGKG